MWKGSPHNPFALSDYEPQRTEYVFVSPDSKAAVLAQLDEHGWNAELVGCHGAGKSTLLYTLARIAQQSGRRLLHFRCNDVEPRLPRFWYMEMLWQRPQIVFLDGAERTLPAQLRWLEYLCARTRTGLVTTAHQPLPEVFKIQVQATASQLCQLLSRDGAAGKFLVDPAAVSNLLDRHGGSARAVLVQLYEMYESRHSTDFVPKLLAKGSEGH